MTLIPCDDGTLQTCWQRAISKGFSCYTDHAKLNDIGPNCVQNCGAGTPTWHSGVGTSDSDYGDYDQYALRGTWKDDKPPTPVQAAPGSQKPRIHIIPHTHNDVGWLKTVDECYLEDAALD